MLIWNTDANGKLGRTNQEQQHAHIIGPYTHKKETEKGNGQRLYNACKTYNMIPMNTWKRPQLNIQQKHN